MKLLAGVMRKKLTDLERRQRKALHNFARNSPELAEQQMIDFLQKVDFKECVQRTMSSSNSPKAKLKQLKNWEWLIEHLLKPETYSREPLAHLAFLERRSHLQDAKRIVVKWLKTYYAPKNEANEGIKDNNELVYDEFVKESKTRTKTAAVELVAQRFSISVSTVWRKIKQHKLEL